MSVKKLVLIRESDFVKLQKTDKALWDTMEFRPVTKAWLQKQASWFTIKGSKTIATAFKHWPYPAEWIRRTTIRLHQDNYNSWLYRWDDAGVLRVRASLGQPESVMGLAILERIEVQLDDSVLPEACDIIDEMDAS